jgi:KUP system potassium uptake protein
MAITTLMATFVALQWKHNVVIVALVNGSLLALDLLFFASTSTKLFEGGWFPLVIAFVISFLMITWRQGEHVLDAVRQSLRLSLEQFLALLKTQPPYHLPGTAVVLGRMGQGVPLPLTQNVSHNHVLHDDVWLVAVESTETPRVPDAERVVVSSLSEGLTRVVLRFGFMESPDVPRGLELAAAQGKVKVCDPKSLTYFAGHETIIPLAHGGHMAHWRKSLYALMHRNAQRPAAYFRIPTAQIMEIGVEFQL